MGFEFFHCLISLGFFYTSSISLSTLMPKEDSEKTGKTILVQSHGSLEEWEAYSLLCWYLQVFLRTNIITGGDLQIVQSCVLQGRFLCEIP